MSGRAAKTCKSDSVDTTSEVLADANVSRSELGVVNTHGSQVLSIMLATDDGVAPTATQLAGIVLYPTGSWITNEFDGAVAIIGSAAATTYATWEF